MRDSPFNESKSKTEDAARGTFKLVTRAFLGNFRARSY
jgi:hypothetical protein